jgi:hypothetical protein
MMPRQIVDPGYADKTVVVTRGSSSLGEAVADGAGIPLK